MTMQWRMSTFAGAAALVLMMAQWPAFAQDSGDTLALQVELARAHASPGAIDGKMGKNTRTAIEAFQQMQGLQPTGEPDEQTRSALQKFASEPVTVDYTITSGDTKGPFIDSIPAQMEEKAKLDRLSYTSPAEALAEKFHMDQDFLENLNKGKDFAKPGTVITVANLADAPPLQSEVKDIKVDKADAAVKVFDAGENLIAQYPATIGSPDTPSPQGNHKIKGVAKMPEYTYDPGKLDFKGVKQEKFTIPPGPNNPVGVVWIDIDAPSYGIHGTADPQTIRRESSHGCVRLTNWDAMQLANAVKPGIPVEFTSGDQQAD
jgi:lipoprotein-anchoring transpeptidase ErfK/SrfK